MRLSVNINDSLFTRILQVANKLEMNKDEFIIKAVKKFLLISDPKELRKKLKPLVKKQGFQSEEDFFNAVS